MNWFITEFKKYFNLGTIVKSPHKIRLDGGFIHVHENGDVDFTMQECLDSITPLEISRERRKQIHDKATVTEMNHYRAKAGQFCWLGMGAFPMGYYYVSYLQQCVGDLRARHLIAANGIIKEAMRHLVVLACRAGRKCGKFIPRVLTFTDAGSSNKQGVYYQERELIGLTFGASSASNFYLLDWKSHKQKRAAQSAGAAEAIAAHVGSNVFEPILNFFPGHFSFGSCFKIAIKHIRNICNGLLMHL